MTIYLYSGTPGSGKSLHAARDVRDFIKYKKLPVIANCDYKGVNDSPLFRYVPNSELTPALLVAFADEYFETHNFREDNILLVLDECQLLFNSREWQDSTRLQWLEFFSQHRKFGYKILFIAQADLMVDRQFRALIEFDCNHRKLANFGIVGKIVSFFVPGSLFCCVIRYYGLKETIGREWFRASKSITRIYDSYSRFKRASPRALAGGSARLQGG